MSQAKNQRAPKRQKGQFLTPQLLALDMLSDIEFKRTDRVLDPGVLAVGQGGGRGGDRRLRHERRGGRRASPAAVRRTGHRPAPGLERVPSVPRRSRAGRNRSSH